MNNYLDQFDGLRKFQLITRYYTADLFTDDKEVIKTTRHVEHLVGKSIEEVRFMYGENSVREIKMRDR